MEGMHVLTLNEAVGSSLIGLLGVTVKSGI